MTMIVQRAEQQTLLTHAGNEEGLCGHCLLFFYLRIPAGSCAPYRRAADFVSRRRREQALHRLQVMFRRPRD
jgi:hypothetical protein